MAISVGRMISFIEDSVLRETPGARRVIAFVVRLVPELFQTFPELILEVEIAKTGTTILETTLEN